MRINGLGNGTYSGTMPAGRRTESGESSGAVSFEELGTLTEPGQVNGQALGEILAQYDVTDITPRDFSELLQKLHKAGALPDDLMKQLALIRADLDRQGIAPDESVNLIEFYSEELQQARLWPSSSDSDEQGPSAAELSTRLGWMKKFSLMHANPDALGLDERA